MDRFYWGRLHRDRGLERSRDAAKVSSKADTGSAGPPAPEGTAVRTTERERFIEIIEPKGARAQFNFYTRKLDQSGHRVDETFCEDEYAKWFKEYINATPSGRKDKIFVDAELVHWFVHTYVDGMCTAEFHTQLTYIRAVGTNPEEAAYALWEKYVKVVLGARKYVKGDLKMVKFRSPFDYKASWKKLPNKTVECTIELRDGSTYTGQGPGEHKARWAAVEAAIADGAPSRFWSYSSNDPDHPSKKERPPARVR